MASMRQCSPRLVFGLALAFAAGAASGYGLCRLTMVAPAPEIRPGALDRTTAGVARAASGAERPERTGRGGRAERGARRTERREAPRETAEDLERTPGGDPRGDDPFAGLSREDLAGAVEQAIASRDGKLFKRAAEALGALEPEEVSRLADLLLTAGDKKVSDLVARQLVRFGGKAGVESVARLARDVSLSLEMRLRFIEALADAGPETREPAQSALGDLVASGLPQKLEFHAAHAFGRLLGDGAVEGLAGLLESGAARAEPLL
ncbi:MAG: hypothetical protein HY721_23415, partial [Planctomycetes bacterium]|nr:hypothetical protein [Planctomycetota bacterium]